MNIIHRDLKPENILIVGKNSDGFPMIKLCDFGTSRIFEKGAVQRKLVGSSYYIDPEVLKKHIMKNSIYGPVDLLCIYY